MLNKKRCQRKVWGQEEMSSEESRTARIEFTKKSQVARNELGEKTQVTNKNPGMLEWSRYLLEIRKGLRRLEEMPKRAWAVKKDSERRLSAALRRLSLMPIAWRIVVVGWWVCPVSLVIPRLAHGEASKDSKKKEDCSSKPSRVE